MRRMMCFAAGLVVVAGCTMPVGRATPNLEQSAQMKEICGKIEALLRGHDPGAIERVIEALGEAGAASKEARQILLGFLFSQECDDPTLDDVASSLARAGEVAVPEVFAKCREAGALGAALERAVLVTGHIGTKAHNALPFLRDRLAAVHDDPRLIGWIRAVMANISDGKEGDAPGLCRDIVNSNERGRAAGELVMRVGGGGWIKDYVVKYLAEQLKGPSEVESFWGAQVLGSLGQAARPAIGALRRVAQAARNDESVSPSCLVVYDLSLAKIDPVGRAQAVRRLALLFGPDGNMDSHAPQILSGLSMRLSGDVIKSIASLLNDTDSSVVTGAITILTDIGRPAKGATPMILEVLRANKDEDVRKRASSSLGVLADPIMIPTLEALAAKEDSDAVRKELAESIRLLRVAKKVRACFGLGEQEKGDNCKFLFP
jgi:hypothetical protein